MQSELLIRQGKPEDAEKLAALAIQVWLHTYATDGISSTTAQYVLAEFTPERFQAMLKRPALTVLVAEMGVSLVGYARVDVGASCAEAASATAELATLYVQEHFIGKGAGSALLGHAEAVAFERTGNPLWLKVNARNNKAIAFYARRGYTKIGIAYFSLGGDEHENLVLLGSAPSIAP
jgi:ribosomal protein S18 acetylase RimI-like enzyme